MALRKKTTVPLSETLKARSTDQYAESDRNRQSAADLASLAEQTAQTDRKSVV